MEFRLVQMTRNSYVAQVVLFSFSNGTVFIFPFKQIVTNFRLSLLLLDLVD